ncbi:hypothetical protein GCM10010372_05950 [Streptomyces tauricus]|uniref:hypothetical protein n=1 Tax=Streptomyces tauricus TaxID=68274 RepID=UPI00167A80FB|nr:hypothetical protein [Streptomyces tauricus]GHA09282.1 hypothetical protein GCM10010372_05950 [Streptomyces tauricus]
MSSRFGLRRPRLLRAATAGLIALGLTGALSGPASAATQVYAENFSAGLGAFLSTGSVSASSGAARLSGSLLTDASLTSAPIALTGYSGVSVSYTRAASGLDLGEAFTVAYSVDGGAFTTLESSRTASGAVSFPLPSSVDGRTVRLRFSLDAGGALETLTVDDVLVRAEGGGPTDPPGGTLPPVTDVTAPGPYPVTIDTTAGPGDDGWLVYPANAGQNGVQGVGWPPVGRDEPHRLSRPVGGTGT